MRVLQFSALFASLFIVSNGIQASPPPDSLIARSGENLQTLLLNPMESPGDIPVTGSWRMQKARVVAVNDPEPMFGSSALRFEGVSEIAGGKGDFSIAEKPRGELVAAGLWVHLDIDANVKTLGLQVYDAEGEVLMYSVPADWVGWRWVEFQLEKDEYKQAYTQTNKNQKLDQPVRGLHLFWFTKEAGPSALIVDDHVGLARSSISDTALATQLFGEDTVEPGQAPRLAVLLSNFSNQPQTAQIDLMLRENPDLAELRVPHPVYGLNRAEGKTSILTVNGMQVDTNSLTDGNPYTGVDRSIDKPGFTEAFHTIDLGHVLTVRRLGYRAADANWIYKMDISASSDGETYTPVAELQNVDVYKHWDEQVIPVPTPFEARYIQLRYHHNGESMGFLRTPSEFRVFDEARPEDYALPNGESPRIVATEKIAIPPHSYSWKALPCPALSTGAYQGVVQIQSGGRREWLVRSFFTMPPEIKKLSPDSPFGMNGSSFELFDINRRLGVSWIRWENLKWAFIADAPDHFAFDGSIAPWHVAQDVYMEEYQKRGMKVLSYTFQTPSWATTAPAGTEKNRQGWPPRNYADYGEAMYQIAARYGTRVVPADTLLTTDKKTGLGQIGVFQLWNEPNLVGPGWAPWVGSMNEYFEIFRIGAEGVKRADPRSVVTHAGLAGIGLELVDTLRTYTYADGKHPLDFTDLITVHYYSGRQNPEFATRDPNANRTGNPIAGQPTFPEQIRDLTDWRDRYAPGKGVWVTETGNDVGGPMGLGEREQAAKLPRVTMLHLAAGVDKVFIYREKGSTASQHAGSGLLRNDNSLRPSFFSVATLIRQFDGVDIKSALRLDFGDPNVWVYLWTRQDNPFITAWTVQGSGALQLGACHQVDSFGRGSELAEDATIQLSIFPVYLSGFKLNEALKTRIQEAKAREQLRLDTIKRDEARLAYLFDFGSTNDVGAMILGSVRPYTPVLSTTVYDDQLGYGFHPGPVMADFSAQWIADKRVKDSTRFRDKQTFRFKAKPGSYHLTLCAAPMADRADLTVQAGGDPIPLAFIPENPRTACTVEMDIEVRDPLVILGVEGMANLNWLSLVQR